MVPRDVPTPLGYLGIDRLVNASLTRIVSTSGGTNTNGASKAMAKRQGYTALESQSLGRVGADAAGHILPRSLGGKGNATSHNIYPQNSVINSGTRPPAGPQVQATWDLHREFEEAVTRAVRRTSDVCFLALLAYPDSSQKPNRPWFVDYVTWNTGMLPHKTPNPAPFEDGSDAFDYL